MITIEFHADRYVELRPEGAMSEDDFEKLRDAFDGFVNEHDSVPNLLVRPKGIPHWASPAAMGKHLHFLKEHHRLVRKVALVGDLGPLAIVPVLADLFVAPSVRHFPADKLDAARTWLESPEDRSGRVEVLDYGQPSDVVALRIAGILTAEDYEETLNPLLEAKLKEHDKIKALVVVDDEFISYTPQAAWADTKLGVRHWTDFRRIALVTDTGWIAGMAKLFAPLMPAEFKAFPVAELDAAKHWILR